MRVNKKLDSFNNKTNINAIFRFIINHSTMVIIKFLKNQFVVVMYIINNPNVQHVYHPKLNNNYYRMKMINKNNIHFLDILNNHFVHYLILINQVFIRNHGQISVE
jgi:hypothetical protein